MEYLDYLRNLSSPDLHAQISSIYKISAFIAAQPSPINVNTIALHMAVIFKDASNRLRYFLAKFFHDRQVEMSMLKSRREFFLNITSVSHSNDPVGQSYMLKIMGSLAGLLSDLLEFQHMVLLSLDSSHPRVQQTAINTIPILLPFAPKLAYHIFNKEMTSSLFLKFLPGVSNNEDVVKAAYSQAVIKFQGEELLRVLVRMTAKAPLMTRHVKQILYESELPIADKLMVKLISIHGAAGLFEKVEVEEMLQKNKVQVINEIYKYDEYKDILHTYKYIPESSNQPIEHNHNYSTDLLSKVMLQVDSGNLTHALEHLPLLNNYQKYQLATRLMQKAHFQQAKTLIDSLLSLHITNEFIYEWLKSLSQICDLELNPSSLSQSYTIIDSLECIEIKQSSYFHTQLIMNRLKLLETLSTQPDLCTLYSLKDAYHSLLYLFSTPRRSTVQFLKYWRDLCGVISVVISYQDCSVESIKDKVKLFYPGMYELVCNILRYEIDIIPQLVNGILNIPCMYPPQFFRFDEILSLHLEVPYENPIKLTRTKEFVFDIGIKLPSLSRKPKTIRFELRNISNQTKRVITHITHDKQTNVSGAAALSLAFTFPDSGQYTLQMSATILNASDTPIGKTEYAELTVSCLLS